MQTSATANEDKQVYCFSRNQNGITNSLTFKWLFQSSVKTPTTFTSSELKIK